VFFEISDPFLYQIETNNLEKRGYLYMPEELAEKIVIFGDYDADGVTGSTILYQGLKIIFLTLHQQGQFHETLFDRGLAFSL
jgi:hypothetical protein